MNAAEAVMLIVIMGMLAVVLAALIRPPRARKALSPSATPGSVPGAVSRPTEHSLVEVVRSADGGFQVTERSSGEVVLDLRPSSVPARNRSHSESSVVPANASFLAGLSGVGIDVASGLTAGTEYVVRFTPKIQALIDSGSATLMRTSRGLVSDAVSRSTGHILEHGTLVESLAQNPAQLLAGGLTAGAAAAQLYQIQAALDRIEKRLDELAGRVRDDDHGELTAAEALVAPLLAAALDGHVPAQLAAELAIHRQRVDSIFFSRQRFVERFRDELQARQDRHAERHDEPKAWARGATKVFGDHETFEAEVLIYARAMSIRARLALSTAAVIALDGQPVVAQWMLRDVVAETIDAFGDLSRRLSALAREDLKWTWLPMSGRKDIQESARDVANLLERDIAPQLPPRPRDTLEFNLQLEPGGVPDSTNGV